MRQRALGGTHNATLGFILPDACRELDGTDTHLHPPNTGGSPPVAFWDITQAEPCPVYESRTATSKAILTVGDVLL